MEIPVVQARELFTKALIAVYKERTTPKSFLRSFFRVVESGSKMLSIEVQRGTEKIAVDVERGTEGNRNSFSRSTEKIFVPPYYREYFDATQMDLYDRLFAASGTIDEVVFSDFINAVADKLRSLQEKIERAYEKQCADVLLDGIVPLQSGVNIDFKRKAGSLVDLGGGSYWTDSVNPYTTLETGANFIRKEGKFGGNVINAILGSEAMAAFLDNADVKERADIKNFSLDQIREPQRVADGTLHGRVSAGAYMVNLWTYNEFYTNSSGVATPFIDPTKVILLPEQTNFVLGFAAVPQLITEGITTTKGAYVFGEYVDQRKVAHVFDIKSAGVAIPVAVDTIYTVKTVA